jgi:hypothetical protein
MADMVCERQDDVCNLCGADPEEDCPLTDLAPELAEWSERKIEVGSATFIVDDTDDCESCQ